jgi:hypothetical protein
MKRLMKRLMKPRDVLRDVSEVSGMSRKREAIERY